jgi:drug/metabolite transporter (DMT)-like permease
MSTSVQIGLLFAVATAFASVVGFLYKHRGAVASPEVEWRRPVSTSLGLFRSPWYVLGVGIALIGWGFHVAALALAPISLVQSVIAGGLVLLTVVADRLFAHSVTRREWIGVGLAAVGLAFLAATLEGTGGEAHSSYQTSRLVAFLVAVSLGAVLIGYFGQRTHHAGVTLGAAAGLLWAASDVAIKASSDSLGEESILLILLSPLAFLILAYSLIGLTVSAKSLQIGKAVPVIALTSVAANALTIAAGPLVFEEPMPDDALGFSIRILAFALVISAAALTPAPVRAAEAELEPAAARA